MMQRLSVEKENALAFWLEAILPGTPIIWAKQDGIKPAAPFVVMDITSGPLATGPAEQRFTSQDTFTYGFRKRGTLNLQFFSSDALVRADAVVNALELPGFQSLLQAAGMAVWGHTGPLDITSPGDTAYQVRATLDVFIAWAQAVAHAPGQIRTVRTLGATGGISTDQTIEVQ